MKKKQTGKFLIIAIIMFLAVLILTRVVNPQMGAENNSTQVIPK